MKKQFLIFSGFILFLLNTKAQSPTPPVKADYAMASRFSPARLQKTTFSTSVVPAWLKLNNAFWYTYQTTDGKRWVYVDIDKNIKRPLFDHAKLAAFVTKVVKDAYDEQHLELENLKFTEDETAFTFAVTSKHEELKLDTTIKSNAARKNEKKVYFFRYELKSEKIVELTGLEKEKPIPIWASFSPDKKMVVFAKNYNLYMMDTANFRKALANEKDSTIQETQLTTDGVLYNEYGFRPPETDIDRDKNSMNRRNPSILWSPDSKHFAAVRSDRRKLKDFWVIHSTTNPRPQLETFKYGMAGEKEQYTDELFFFNIDTKKKTIIDISAYKDQDINLLQKRFNTTQQQERIRPAHWLGTSDRFYFTRTSRDYKRLDVCAVDLNSEAKANAIIEERGNTYVELLDIDITSDGKEIIEWSERDGWAHYYLYDNKGSLKNQITQGSFHSNSISHIDEANRVLYFTAEGVEKGQDPFYSHLCRVNLDGSNFKVLNSGNYTSLTSVKADGRYFVNNASRVDAAPVSQLFDNTGKKILDLEITDLRQLIETGYRFPEPIKVKAADGITDLYGVMYKPYKFDSTKSYPIVVYVYPGPQADPVNRYFSGKFMDKIDRLAQLGFICISIGNRGGHPDRSKWYHDYGYGDMRDYGLADIKASVEQLSYRHSYIDINRVGIHGHSGGAFMSTAAMLAYPDFFKVAVSSSGNHENNIYNRWWSEKYHGIKEVISNKNDTSFVYTMEKNPDLVKNLKGRLFITTGEIDNNVNPAATIRMANALIKANKRFDFLILPGQRHQYTNMSEYFFWVMADYFVKHLLGDFTQQPVDILEIERDIEKTQ